MGRSSCSWGEVVRKERVKVCVREGGIDCVLQGQEEVWRLWLVLDSNLLLVKPKAAIKLIMITASYLCT